MNVLEALLDEVGVWANTCRRLGHLVAHTVCVCMASKFSSAPLSSTMTG